MAAGWSAGKENNGLCGQKRLSYQKQMKHAGLLKCENARHLARSTGEAVGLAQAFRKARWPLLCEKGVGRAASDASSLASLLPKGIHASQKEVDEPTIANTLHTKFDKNFPGNELVLLKKHAPACDL